MRIYFAKSTGGFYSDELHGVRELEVEDRSVTRPTKRIPDPKWVPPAQAAQLRFDVELNDFVEVPTDKKQIPKAPLIEVDDMAWVPPHKMVPNPACSIPADAVEISAEEHQQLLRGPSNGMEMIGNAAGHPILQPRTITADEILARRDALLSGSDWVTARAIDLGEGVSANWREYRQALRDITEQAGFPSNVTWPSEPESA